MGLAGFGRSAVNRTRREQLATGATMLRARVAAASAKRGKSDPRAEAFENLLHAIDGLLAVLELEAGEPRKLN
jgi:hypothetical protein